MRSLYVIESLTLKYDHIDRLESAIHDVVGNLGGSSKLEQLLQSSIRFAKHYISILAFNLEVEAEINFEKDPTILRAQIKKALDLNDKYLKPKQYQKLTVRI